MARRTWLAIALVACAFEAARAADILDLGDTNVVTAETKRAVYSVAPSESTALGGARVHIIGEGFATDIFDGSNAVAIGSDAKGWVACDVIEGACTVDCGGPRKIVCDTGAWVSDASDSWLDVRVTIDESVQTYEAVCSGCFAYKATSESRSPVLESITPRHQGAGGVLLVRGANFGEAVEDYYNIYVGVGRPPQGGNIDTGDTNTHAVCRPDDLNLAVDLVTGELDGASLPVMAEDAVVGHGAPILADAVYCALGDFAAGSYNLSAFLGDQSTQAAAPTRASASARGLLGPLKMGATNISRDGTATTTRCSTTRRSRASRPASARSRAARS